MNEMTVVDVDLTSLFGVAQALTVEKPSRWALGSYYDVSLAILEFPHTRVPSPSETEPIPRIKIQPIQDKLETHGRIPPKVRAEAIAYAQSMDSGDTAFFRERLRLLRVAPEYAAWLGWHIEYEWMSHIDSLGHRLIETANIPMIAHILERPVLEIDDANMEVKNRADAARICANPSDLHKDIYTVDVALRGRYYEKLSLLTGGSFVMHPIRRWILRDGTMTSGYSTPVSARLAAIIGNWARKQPMESRVEQWTHMMLRSKNEYQPRIDRRESTGVNPEEIAITIAKEIGIDNPIGLSNEWAIIVGTLAAGVGLIVENAVQAPDVPELV